jgi:signal recognition particle subunit SRP54
MQQLRKAGSIKGMLGMLPGAKGMREALDNFDEGEIVRTEAIIQSMTKQERELPKLLNGSRRLRIAKGSGTTVTEVNALVNRFEQAAKMMKTVARGGVPQMPGMGPIPGMHGGKKKQQPAAGKKKKVGNPAKRAALASGAAAQPQQQAPKGSGFGFGGAKGAKAPTEEELQSLQKFLGR